MKLNMREETFIKLIENILNGRFVEKRYIKKLNSLLSSYENISGERDFLSINFNGNINILDKKGFELFVCRILNIKDIKDIYKQVSTKKEAIEKYNNSKYKNIHTDDQTIVIRRKKNRYAEIYYKEFPVIDNNKFIAVIENYETFLTLDFSFFYPYNVEVFIYISGNPSTFKRKFLEDKKVIFFVDFDFASLFIFFNTKCKQKLYFVPDNIECYFKKYNNPKLYHQSKARKYIENNKNLLNKYSETKKIYDLIEKYGGGLEQEKFNPK